jgi:hypothetical protein
VPPNWALTILMRLPCRRGHKAFISKNYALSLKIKIKNMETMSVSEFKTRFSDVITQVEAVETIVVASGKNKKVVGYFTAELPQKRERKLGILEGKATFIFAPDFKMTEEEFLNYGKST